MLTLTLRDLTSHGTGLKAYAASKKKYKKNVYEFPSEMVELVDRHWGEYVERWGYGVPG